MTKMAEEKTIVPKEETSEEIINKKVSDFVEKRRKQQIKLLSDLIAQNTVNPPGNEKLAAAVIKKHLDKLKVKYKTFEKTKGRTNLIATVGNTDKSAKKIMLATHLDTVPAGEGWDTDPFKATVKDNLLYGRGACDDKGQASACLLVLEYLKSVEKDLKNQFLFVFSADEETGGSEGLKYLLAKKLVSADYAVVVDISGSLKNISVAEKGTVNVKVTCLGKQAHGSTPHKGVSAIVNMAKLITKLDYYNFKYEIHPLLSKPTINFGTIQGGTAFNNVAAKCELVLNIRYLPSQTKEGIVEELQTLAERFGEFKFEIIADHQPSEIDSDNILVKTIMKVTETFGIQSKPYGLNGGTDAKALVLNGIPAVGFDFADSYVAHNANEFCNLDNLFKFCKIMIDVCTELDKYDKL